MTFALVFAWLGCEAERAQPVFRDPPARVGEGGRVVGYLAYWDDELATVPWEDLTDLALFSAGATADGVLFDTYRWDLTAEAVALGDPHGVAVQLCVTNFNSTELDALLNSADARSTLVAALASEVASRGAHGVNVDFEGLPLSARDGMVAFIDELAMAVPSVMVAIPPVDWEGSWDVAALTASSDLFIMGYNYHGSWSSEAGPVDPLDSGPGTPFPSTWSLRTTVADILGRGADPMRTILGLPLYGAGWATGTEAVPSSSSDGGWSVLFRDAVPLAEAHGRRYEETTQTPWVYDGTNQVWYGDAESVRPRIQMAMDEGLGGIGFWALHYDAEDPEIWNAVRETVKGPEVAIDLVADAGFDLVARIGDLVQLDGQASEGPEPLAFTWTQVMGPKVALKGRETATPSFDVEEAGQVAFEVVVSSGGRESLPARVDVVVIDPDGPSRWASGCSSAPSFGLWGALAYIIRSRQARPRRLEAAS